MTDIELFNALASKTRIQLLEHLRSGPHSVNQLAARVPVSQPAVSQHLSVLLDAQLVQVQREGNQRIYMLNPQGLRTLRGYAESLWEDVLDAFKQAADREAKEV